MRVAAGSAFAAVRPIAQMVWRVDIAQQPSSLPTKLADRGKVHVKAVPAATLLTECGRKNQALNANRSTVLPQPKATRRRPSGEQDRQNWRQTARVMASKIKLVSVPLWKRLAI